MNDRLKLATIAVLGMALLAGCLGGGLSEDTLTDEETEYDWDTDANVTYELERGSVFSGDSAKAVFQIDGDREVELYRRAITNTRSVSIEAVQFRHPDGTVEQYDPERFAAEDTGRETVVQAPEEEGQLAVTVSTRPRQFRLATTASGSVELRLPPDHGAGDLLLGSVSPRGSSTEQRGNQTVYTWDDMSSGDRVAVNYYLTRDRVLFYSLVVGLGLVAVGVVVYFRRRLAALREQRAEDGLELDPDEYDDGDDPPPGFG